MAITAAQVKELRETTGAGMMDCKKALEAANGDMDAAIEAMRIAGTAKAAKKAGRVTAEGGIAINCSTDGLSAAMVEVNCETDFVGRDTHFKAFTTQVAESALKAGVNDINALSSLPLGQSTVEEARQELINKLGENVQVRRIAYLKATGVVGSYVHSGRIGVLVCLSVPNIELAKDLAMHIAAANPTTIHPEEVSADLVAKEKEIFIAQSANSGKPAEIIEKMVAGRIAKFLNEVSLTGQPFVKDPNQTVGALLKQAKAQVTAFARFEVGEGIEKQVEDFAEAVRAQIGTGSA